MNGPHDMGGMQCFGPVVPEADEPVFHGEWEKKALALTVAMGFSGMWNIDQSRFARESLPPAQYLSSTYYQIWLAALERLMAERGMVEEAELVQGRVLVPPVEPRRPVPDRDAMRAGLARGGPTLRDADRPARFAPGDMVTTLNRHPPGHTRLPRYARGKSGRVIHVNGCHVFPDTNALLEGAAGAGENPQWLYTVVFRAADLFGTGDHEVTVDCFEPYLEPAS